MTARPYRSLAATTLAGIALATALAGCSTTDRGSAPALQRQATWAVLPFENHTETPMAGQRAEAIAEALLHAKGVGEVKRYAGPAQQDTLFGAPGGAGAESSLNWARDLGAAYALTGTVDEWRYKVGVDGEPAAGVTLRIIDVKTGATLWTGAGGKSGWSREALSAVGQKLIRGLLDSGLGNVR